MERKVLRALSNHCLESVSWELLRELAYNQASLLSEHNLCPQQAQSTRLSPFGPTIQLIILLI